MYEVVTVVCPFVVVDTVTFDWMGLLSYLEIDYGTVQKGNVRPL